MAYPTADAATLESAVSGLHDKQTELSQIMYRLSLLKARALNKISAMESLPVAPDVAQPANYAGNIAGYEEEIGRLKEELERERKEVTSLKGILDQREIELSKANEKVMSLISELNFDPGMMSIKGSDPADLRKTLYSIYRKGSNLSRSIHTHGTDKKSIQVGQKAVTAILARNPYLIGLINPNENYSYATSLITKDLANQFNIDVSKPVFKEVEAFVDACAKFNSLMRTKFKDFYLQYTPSNTPVTSLDDNYVEFDGVPEETGTVDFSFFPGLMVNNKEGDVIVHLKERLHVLRKP